MKETSVVYFGDTGKTPIGDLWIAVSEFGLVSVETGLSREEFRNYLVKRYKLAAEFSREHISAVAGQLREYLSGQRREFEITMDWTHLRPFQKSVLLATSEIPYGETRTYKQIAERIGRLHAARAVGRAEATNPIPLVVPCHRVIGADGKLRGYGLGEGVRTKEFLLLLEGAVMA